MDGGKRSERIFCESLIANERRMRGEGSCVQEMCLLVEFQEVKEFR